MSAAPSWSSETLNLAWKPPPGGTRCRCSCGGSDGGATTPPGGRYGGKNGRHMTWTSERCRWTSGRCRWTSERCTWTSGTWDVTYTSDVAWWWRARCRYRKMKELLWLCLIMLGLALVAPPVRAQSGAPLRYTIREELPANAFVGNIARDTGLIVSRGMELELRFPQGDDNYIYFKLNRTTGILLTARPIDRERVCLDSSEGNPCAIKFTVLQEKPFFHVIKVEVYLQDYNDHSPQFPQGRIALTISETTKPDTTFSIPSAEDLDGGINSVQNYELLSDTNKFGLQFTNDSGIIRDLNLVLKGSLDREREQSYNLVVTAMDGGKPSRTGSMAIDITVGDANDNNPKFDNDTYEVTVPENIAEHTKVLQVYAHDPDAGLNGDLVYDFAPDTRNRFGDLFMINAISGGIYIKGEVDYERGEVYHLTVTAQDQGTNSLPAYAKVIVHVGDVNDHAPHITVNSLDSRELGSEDSAFIKEHLAAGTFVAHVSVSDPDAGTNGRITCILRSLYFELVPTANTDYQIISRVEFDREEQSEYRVSLQCTDHGDPQLTSIKDIVVKIIDVNDNGPKFYRPVYSVNMDENNAIDSIIYQINATDSDSGRNAAIKYRLLRHEDEQVIKLEPITGIIKARVRFDYEVQERYEFVILASDQGSPPHTATSTLILNILDTNDGKPQFSLPEYKFEIYENMPPHIKVGLLSASDVDDPPYNDILYSLSKTSEGLEAFSINPDNGELTTSRELDREKHQVYHLVVVASNRGFTKTNASVNVTVTVIDQNDNGPVFVFPTQYNNTAHVADDINLGETITKVTARDADTGRNADLRYSLLQGNATFSIDPRTGIIKVINQLHCLSARMCKVMVKVKDNGTPQRSARAELNVMPKSAAAFGNRSLEAMFFLNGTNVTIIIAAAVVSILLLVLIIVVFCRRRRRRCDKKRDREEAKITSVTDSTDGEISIKSLKNGKLPNGCFDTGTIKPKKEVKFIVENPGRCGESSTDDLTVSWPSKLDSDMMEDPHSRSSSMGSPTGTSSPHYTHHHTQAAPSSSSSDKLPIITPWLPRHHGNVNPQMATPPLKRSSPIAPLTEMEIEMTEVLQMLSREQDSETGSITDSGRGPSEEGDNNRPSPLDTQLSDEQKGCRLGADGRGRTLDGHPTSDLLRSKSSELFASFKRPNVAGSSKSSLRGKRQSMGSHIPPPPPPPSVSTYATIMKHKPSVAPLETIAQEPIIHGGMSSFKPSLSSSWAGSSSSSSSHSHQRSSESSSGYSTASGPLGKFRFQGRKCYPGVGDDHRTRESPYQTALNNLSGRPGHPPPRPGETCSIVETNLDDPDPPLPPPPPPVHPPTSRIDSNGNKDKRTVNFDLSSATFPGSRYNNNETNTGSLKRRTEEYVLTKPPVGSEPRLYRDPRPDPPLKVYDTSPTTRLQHMDTSPTTRLQHMDTSPTTRLQHMDTSPTTRLQHMDTSPTTRLQHMDTSPTTRLQHMDTSPTTRLQHMDTSPTTRLQQMEMTSLKPPGGGGGGQGGHLTVSRRTWVKDTDVLSDDSTTTSGSYVLNSDSTQSRDPRQSTSDHFVV